MGLFIGAIIVMSLTLLREGLGNHWLSATAADNGACRSKDHPTAAIATSLSQRFVRLRHLSFQTPTYSSLQLLGLRNVLNLAFPRCLHSPLSPLVKALSS